MPPSQAHTASSHPFGDGISLFGLSMTEANLIVALDIVMEFFEILKNFLQKVLKRGLGQSPNRALNPQ